MPAITPERMYINQQVQLGVETTAGVDVAANRLLESISLEMGDQIDIKKYRAIGRKYPRVATIGNEMVSLSYAGKPTFDEQTYIFCGQWGLVVPSAQGALGKVWTFPLVLSGPQSPQTYSLQQGDQGVTRAQKVNFGLFADYTLKITDTDNDISGQGISHPVQDNITMTASPTVVALLNGAIGKPMWQLTIDPTSAALGTTIYNTVLDCEFAWGSAYKGLYPIKRVANNSFKNIVDTEPKATLKVILEADAQGMGLLSAVRANQLQYARLDAIGAMIENSYLVNVGGATGGTFTLSFNGQTTAAQAFNVAAATLQTAFTGLSSVGGGNATVVAAGSNYLITFTGTLASTTIAPTMNGSALTGTTVAPYVDPTAYTQRYEICLLCTQVDKYQNKGEVYAIGFTFDLFEDPNWLGGKVGTAMMRNVLASL